MREYICRAMRFLNPLTFLADRLERLAMEIRIMSVALDNLTAKVEAQSTVIASAETLLKTLADEVRALPADDSDAIQALADKIDAQTSELSAAVSANTPADGSATPPASDAPAPVDTPVPSDGTAPGTPTTDTGMAAS